MVIDEGGGLGARTHSHAARKPVVRSVGGTRALPLRESGESSALGRAGPCRRPAT